MYVAEKTTTGKTRVRSLAFSASVLLVGRKCGQLRDGDGRPSLLFLSFYVCFRKGIFRVGHFWPALAH